MNGDSAIGLSIEKTRVRSAGGTVARPMYLSTAVVVPAGQKTVRRRRCRTSRRRPRRACESPSPSPTHASPTRTAVEPFADDAFDAEGRGLGQPAPRRLGIVGLRNET